MRELTLQATVENLDTVLAFLEEQLEEAECPMKVQMQIAIAAEELFVNIAHYAYAPDTGDAVVQTELLEDPRGIAITFLDSGSAFDPLAKEDPDVTLPAEERGIGGLGIYMVKKTMDSVTYRRENGKNILRITKNF